MFAELIAKIAALEAEALALLSKLKARVVAVRGEVDRLDKGLTDPLRQVKTAASAKKNEVKTKLQVIERELSRLAPPP